MDYNDDFEEFLDDSLPLDDGSPLDEEQIIYNEPPQQVNKPREPKEKISLREKANKAVEKTGDTIDNAGKAVSGTGRAINAAGKGVEMAGKGTEMAGKGMEVAGKGMQAVGKAANAAGDAALKAGEALSSTGVGAIAGVPLAALGALGKAVGTGADAAGKGTEAAGKGAQKAGKGMQKTGKGMQKAGDKVDDAGKRISDKGKNIKDAVSKKSSSVPKLKGAGNKGTVGLQQNSTEDTVNNAASKVQRGIGNAIKDVQAYFKAVPTSLEDVGRKARVMVIIFFAVLVSSIMLLYLIFSPVLDVIQELSEKWDSIKLKVESDVNLYNGFGHDSTKEAFYHEMNYLYEDYDEQLDLSLLMATLFYKEKEGYNTDFGNNPLVDDNIDGIDINSLMSSAREFLMTEFRDMFEDLDEDGKNYTIGKIYRVRKLARNQLDTSIFGNGGIPTQEEEVTLEEFADRAKDRMSADMYEFLQSIAPPDNVWDAITGSFKKLTSTVATKAKDVVDLIQGRETWSTTSLGNSSESSLALFNLIKETVLTGIEVTNIRYDFDSKQFMVTIYKYEQNLDNYKKYLKDYYIPNMPEFREDLKGLKGAEKESAIDYIIEDIFEYSAEFDEIFGYNQSKASDSYNAECVGNVDEGLVNAIKRLPVDATNYRFIGQDAYGISSGTKNNGVNLSQTSAGVKLGDNVYSIYGGKVIEVSKKNNCNTEDDDTCDPQGNYVRIKHDNIKSDGNKYEIETFYSNLKDIKVKKGDTVKQGQVIGTVGETGNAVEPMVHFEILDKNSNKNLNPTNLFIHCESKATLVGGSDKEKIWCYLTKSLGYSKGKAAGTMANLQRESGLISYRVQGDYSNGYTASKEYTSNVDKRKISKSEFANKGPGGGGYGLAQWTSPGRKENLYNSLKNQKLSIGDLGGQLKFLGKELNNPSAWTKGYSDWKSASNSVAGVKSATAAMMTGFERPKDQSSSAISGRQETGVTLYNQLKDKSCESSTNMNNLQASSNTSDKRTQIVEYAKSFVGHPYVYGGTKLCTNWKGKSSCGVDCSGFTQAVFKKFGYNLSRTSQSQKNDGKKVSESNMKPGDIIVYKIKDGNGHVAIYIGNNKIVHAASKSTGVKISTNYKYRAIESIRNVVGD